MISIYEYILNERKSDIEFNIEANKTWNEILNKFENAIINIMNDIKQDNNYVYIRKYFENYSEIIERDAIQFIANMLQVFNFQYNTKYGKSILNIAFLDKSYGNTMAMFTTKSGDYPESYDSANNNYFIYFYNSQYVKESNAKYIFHSLLNYYNNLKNNIEDDGRLVKFYITSFKQSLTDDFKDDFIHEYRHFYDRINNPNMFKYDKDYLERQQEIEARLSVLFNKFIENKNLHSTNLIKDFLNNFEVKHILQRFNDIDNDEFRKKLIHRLTTILNNLKEK